MHPQSASHPSGWLFGIALHLCLALALVGCGREQQAVELAGSTMGTTWHVTYVPSQTSRNPEQVQQTLEALLEDVNASMSTWRPDSEISRFNRSPVGAWFPVSPDFARVLAVALAIGDASDGAYDVTVGPLVSLWGFGPGQPGITVPEEGAIDAALQQVGQGHLEFDSANSRLRRTQPVELDFSSIAKGYAVDVLAQALQSEQIGHYLVEVGGEMRVAGNSPRGDAWRVAIEQPHSGERAVALAVALTDKAIATSGDYRNFFEVDGKRFSHSIDPRTGYPIAHDLVSVTVIADDCTSADAWATALTVMGADAALALAERRQLAVYLMRRSEDGIVTAYSSAFQPWLAAPEFSQ
ncbi:FAD:protein FMN transferase [Kineobactrum sediminis]|uniref:FAD:protein FMN transferase n=1 Tax=Kineobactrum sediminis TaxID=1905677 RepID=UPI00138FD0FA|nr:FAD:protein FMN transferase [Kineobactrum sediminis]